MALVRARNVAALFSAPESWMLPGLTRTNVCGKRIRIPDNDASASFLAEAPSYCTLCSLVRNRVGFSMAPA